MDRHVTAGETPTESPVADRIRDLKRTIARIGKRGTGDVLDLGKALEEASVLLRGGFEDWVQRECRIDPRTVRGYRRAHRVLGGERALLVRSGVAPTLVVRLASLPVPVRARALAMIASGRDMKLADLAALAGDPSRRRDASGGWIERAATASARAFARELGSVLGTVAEAMEAKDQEGLDAAAAAAPALADRAVPFLGVSTGNRLAAALRTFGESLPGANRERAASDVLRSVAPTDPAAAPSSVASVPARARPDHGRHVPRSIFDHGLTALEVCAGAGGQALGMARAGFDHVAMVETNKSACGTLKRAFPGVSVLRQDLRTFRPVGIEGLDVLAGGVPCQPFSQNGERLGRDDPRDLFPTVVGLVGELMPRAVMLENVKGIFAARYDEYRAEILGRLAALGYSCEWRPVDASRFGVPQTRVRALLVGFREPEAMARFAWPGSRGGYGEYPWTMGSALLGEMGSQWWKPPEEVLDAMDRLAPTVVGGSERKRGTGLGRGNSVSAWIERGISGKAVGGKAPSHDHEGPVRMTLEMWARLQDFPPAWPFPKAVEPRFRQIGNAFPPIVALYLGCAIASALDGRTFDPERQVRAEIASRRLSPRKPTIAEGNDRVPSGTMVAGREGPRRIVPFEVLRTASSMDSQEEWNPTMEAPGPPDRSEPPAGAEPCQ